MIDSSSDTVAEHKGSLLQNIDLLSRVCEDIDKFVKCAPSNNVVTGYKTLRNAIDTIPAFAADKPVQLPEFKCPELLPPSKTCTFIIFDFT